MNHQQTPSDSVRSPVIAGVPTSGLSRAVFVSMNNDRYDFSAEYKTKIFINGNNTITVLQTTDDINDPESMVVIQSKKRANEIGRAILALAKVASFKPEDEE